MLASKRFPFSILLTYAIVSFGCATAPPGPPGTTSAYSVGDRARATFDEIIISLPLGGSKTPYQHLHISVTAFINPILETNSFNTWEAESILQRCAPRVPAR